MTSNVKSIADAIVAGVRGSPVASDGAGGLLSQAIQNLPTTFPALGSAFQIVLGSDAFWAKEQAATQVLLDEVGKIRAVQSAIGQFVADARPRLQRAKADLDAGTNLDQVTAAINQTQASATALKPRVDELSADFNAIRTQIADLSTSLAPVENRLNAEIVTLNARIEAIQREIREGREGGILGLTNYMKEGGQKQDQVKMLSFYRRFIELTVVSCSDIITRLSGLGNAVRFVAGDNSGVISGLQDARGEQIIANVYLTTAISQLQTLAADAA